MKPELAIPAVLIGCFMVGVIGLALLVDYYVERRFGIHEEDLK
jgi:hypothetical protein